MAEAQQGMDAARLQLAEAAEAVTPYSKPSPQPLNPTFARSLALALP